MAADTAEGAAPPVAPTEDVELADVGSLVKYLRRVVPVLLEEDEVLHPSLDTALGDKTNLEVLRKFIADPQVKTLLVQRSSSKDEELVGEGGGDVEEETVTYTISSEVHFTNPKINSLVIIKKYAVIEADKKVPSQLRVMNLNDASPYETLHSYVSSAVAPYFKSYVKETGRAESLAMVRCAEEGRRATAADFGDRTEDSSFLNQLQNGVNRWIREIQKVTKLDRDPSSGTALQEISFWLNLERALLRIQEKRESLEVALTLDLLKKGKRFHATVSFDTDTGLKQALATVNDYNPLMKDFPLNDLLAATDLDRIRLALHGIFSHLRKIRSTKYPIQRALRLVEAISRDLMTQMLKVLGTRRLMHAPFDHFESVMSACLEVFNAWDEEYDKLQSLLRDIVKKKRDEHIKTVWRVTPAHKRLQARMEQMRKFRRQHEQLRTVIVRVLRPVAAPRTVQGSATTTPDTDQPELPEAAVLDSADSSAIEEVNLAYENVKEVDGLDISKEGTEAWDAAVKRYEERIDRVEARITGRLRDQLGTAKNANEMFRIFSRFNALFVRPHIRGAIREYQTQLMQRVKDDIEALHEKFKVQYTQSKACLMSKERDLPPVAGSIIWAKQIDRQLSVYMKRVEDVLGKGWENHVEGQKLKSDADSFRAKLSTQPIFDEWSRLVQQRQLGVTGRIFAIDNQRSRTGNLLRLKVNFLPEIITLAKEVRNLKWMGFRVPLAIVNKAHQANQLYPFAISLIESVRTYERTCEKVEERPSITLLIAGQKREVQNLIAEGIGLVWESYKLDPYVQKLAETVFNFQEKVDDLMAIEEQIDIDVRSLETCPYSASTFAEILNKIQKAVDDLSLHQYSNLHHWVSKLDEQVEAKLAGRLEAGIQAWTLALEGKKEGATNETDPDATTPGDKEGGATVHHPLGGEPQVHTLVHEVRITNQVMYLSPSLEESRFSLLQQLFAWQNIVLSQIRIQSTRYQVGLERQETPTYRGLLRMMMDGTNVLEKCYGCIEAIVKQVKVYVSEWLRYQALWDLQQDMLYNRLGDDIGLWMRTLVEIKKSRTTFDTSDVRKKFGPIIIDYAKVQSKVTLKYDSWHKEVLGKFGTLLGNDMAQFHTTVSKSRSELEQQSIDTASTSDAVSFITYVQSLKRKMKSWEQQVELYKEGQRILERQRFQFPNWWLHVDNVEGEWSAFTEMMRRKDTAISSQVASLQMKVVAEDRAVEARTADFLADWEKSKPVQGSLKPSEATSQLAIFESKFSRLKEDRENLVKAKRPLSCRSLV
ncbi:hypothetical protein HPB52_012721 [Rhipicephalus sanguineus]|uniref:Dynein heavy chain tail domain-containing protein n=1 Tax=Rhipicephalus sanguineus TaxID=34632 RepID=A0A9D4QAX7_RHISA|nr:hypothetical protein HPB52_012721 [Rhipicephalus sanguineus]